KRTRWPSIPTSRHVHRTQITFVCIVTMRSLLLSLVSNALVAAAISTTPSVTIDAGTLEGGQCNGSSDAAYFKSIPFALPPTGSLRFAPPQPYTKKYPGGSLVATSPAASCIQFGAEFAETDDLSEDWLV